MSLDRLIRLAKKTGDRLIVHDPIQGNDMVILSVDDYEKMVDHVRADERSFSDIDRWRDTSDIDDFPFGDNYQNQYNENNDDEEISFNDDESSPWHSTRDLFSDRYGGSPWMDRFQDEDEDGKMIDDRVIDDRDVLPPLPSFHDTDPFSAHISDEIEAIAFDDVAPVPSEDPLPHTTPVAQPVPFVEQKETAAKDEESLKEGQNDDEPVFLEEPV